MEKTAKRDDIAKPAPSSPKQNSKKITLKTIGIPLALLVLLVLFFMPTPDGLVLKGKKPLLFFVRR